MKTQRVSAFQLSAKKLVNTDGQSEVDIFERSEEEMSLHIMSKRKAKRDKTRDKSRKKRRRKICAKKKRKIVPVQLRGSVQKKLLQG